MWILRKQFRFEASHQLTNHDGACARLHGHSWEGEIEVEGNVLVPSGPKEGMVMDYSDLSKVLDPIVKDLDHRHLNDVLKTNYPTSEVVAQWVYERIKRFFPRDGIHLRSVTIKETCTSSCTYLE